MTQDRERLADAVRRAASGYLLAGRPDSMGTVCAKILFDALESDVKAGSIGRTRFSRRELLEAMRAHPDWRGKEFEETSFNSVPEEIGRRLRDERYADPVAGVRVFGPTRRFRMADKEDPRLFLEVEPFPVVSTAGVAVPVVAPNPPGQGRAIPKTDRVLAFMLAGSIAAIVIFGFARMRSSGQTARALEVRKVTTTGVVLPAAISPNGDMIAYVHDRHSLRVKNLNAESEAEIYATKDSAITRLRFTPDGGLIFFTVLADGGFNADLYSIAIAGGRPRRVLTNLSGPAMAFAFDPQGTRVAFMRGDAAIRHAVLAVSNVDGSEERTLASLTDESCSHLAWSPDGSTIVCASFHRDRLRTSAAPSILAIDRQTGTVRRISTGKTWFPGVEFEPEGRSLIAISGITHGGQVWRIHYPEGTADQLTHDFSTYMGLSASRDASRILTRRRSLSSNLWRVDLSTRQATRFTSGEESGDGMDGLAVLPGGRALYARAIKPSGPQLWITPVGGGSDTTLSRPFERLRAADASRDGSRVAVVRGVRRESTFAFDVYLVRVADGVEEQLTHDGEVTHAVFSPDDQWVYYVRGEEQAVWMVSVHGGTPSRVLDGYCSDFKLSPDGRLAACGENPSALRERRIADDRQLDFLKLSLSVFSWHDRKVLRRFDIDRRYFDWTPNGDAIAYVCGPLNAANVCVQPLDGGGARQITKFEAGKLDGGRISRFAWSENALIVSRTSEEIDAVLVTGLPPPD
jgi:Tol biopolymer transport system component